MGVKEDWRVKVDTLTWDNRARSGALPIRSFNLRVEDPTTAKQIDIVLELTTATKAIEQGDIVQVDGYSDEAAGWVNLLYGEVVELERDSGAGDVRLTCYCAMWWAAAKEIAETTLVSGTLVRETFRCYNAQYVTLANSNELVHVPLEEVLLREPLLMYDQWDVNNPVTYTISSNNAGYITRCAVPLMWLGQSYQISEFVLYVVDWAAQPAGSVQVSIRSGTAKPYTGGVQTVLATWLLATAPNGPVADRYGNNRRWLTFSFTPVTVPEGWAWLEFELINCAGAPATSVQLHCTDASMGAGRLANNGAGAMWTQTSPATPAVDTGGLAGRGRVPNFEMWSPDTWYSFSMGKRPEQDKGTGDYIYEPSQQWAGYVIEANDYWNTTQVSFSKLMTGSIDSAIKNVDIYYRKSWGTLSNLLNSLYDNFLSDTYDARDFSVTDDENWVDQKAKYTNALAIIRAVCEKSELAFESYWDLGASQVKLRIRDRKLSSEWSSYTTAQQNRRTFIHGDDDTSLRDTYSTLLDCVYKKNKYSRRDIWVIDLAEKGKNNPAATAAACGGTTGWDAACAKEGADLTIGVEVGGPRSDLDPGAAGNAFAVLQSHTDTMDNMEEEVEVEVDDVDPNILTTINQVVRLQDTRVGLAASEWAMRGWTLRVSVNGGAAISMDFEKRIKWRKSKWLDRKKPNSQEVEDLNLSESLRLGSIEQREVLELAFPVSWATQYNGKLLSTATQIGIGNSSATNSLTAFDSMIAKKTCVIQDVPGTGKVLSASFEWSDYLKSYGSPQVQEVGILDAVNGVIYRRAFKTPLTANWYFHRFVTLGPQVKLTVVILVKD